ncbi:MAG: hypothetical protein M3Z66_21845, partial [Chloroflexota bacterium]|nr:hypothetical protein [Chloroflexota bacterium]
SMGQTRRILLWVVIMIPIAAVDSFVLASTLHLPGAIAGFLAAVAAGLLAWGAITAAGRP